MANALYSNAKKKLLSGYINLGTNTIKASLVDSGVHAISLTADTFFSSIPANAIIATQTLASKFISAASNTVVFFDAADVTFPTVSASANTIEYVLIYQDTGTAANSCLIAAIDTATGLPVTPNGGDITIVWDSGANHIFALT